jgi:uncharacterized repeat protein (TIGR01451 family)
MPANDNQTIELDFSFLADSTGQSGAALSDIVYWGINYGPVDNGAGPGGTDSGITDDGGSIATLTSETLIGDVFQPGSKLLGTIEIDDLEAGEQLVLRIDVRIACDLNSKPTGNLQAKLEGARVVDPLEEAISGGAQTIPFKQIGNILFPGLNIRKTVTKADGSCLEGQESLDIYEGNEVRYCYEVINTGDAPAYNVTVIDDNGTSSDSDDFDVALTSGLTDEDGDTQADDLGVGTVATGEYLTRVTAPLGETVVNTATADADNADPDSDTATVNVFLFGDLVIEKTVTTEDGNCLVAQEELEIASGDAVRYCYRVENTGTVPAYNVTVIDDNGTPDDSGDDFTVILISGLSDLDGDGQADDLDLGAIAYGEVVVQIREPKNTKLVGTATANADDISPASDDATVIVGRFPAGGLVISVTASTDATCPGVDVVNVLAGAEVTWCYEVSNTTNFALKDVAVMDNLLGLIGTIPSIAPGVSTIISKSNPEDKDAVHVGSASGTDEFGNQRDSNLDPAAVNVVHPGIQIDKTVSTDGTCPGVDFLQILGGTEVTYCYKVTNSGDTDLSSISVTDDKLGDIGAIPSLAAMGGTTELKSDPVEIIKDMTNIAKVKAIDQYGNPVEDADTVIVDALLPDLAIIKEGTILVNVTETNSVVYTLTVENQGDATADNVMVMDQMPVGLIFVTASVSSQGTTQFSWNYDTEKREFSCSLGSLEPGNVVTITIEATADIRFGKLENEACTKTDTLEINLANNCDKHITWVAPGATRTIGFYKNHPSFTAQCLEAYAQIHQDVYASHNGFYLGYLILRDEAFDDEIDATRPAEDANVEGSDCGAVELGNEPDDDLHPDTALEMALGVLKANPAKLRDGTRRSPLDHARTVAGRQLLVAICNETLLGSDSGMNFVDAVEVLGGCDLQEILELGGIADLFNNSGDMIDLGVDCGPADPWARSDDPTDPNDPKDSDFTPPDSTPPGSNEETAGPEDLKMKWDKIIINGPNKKERYKAKGKITLQNGSGVAVSGFEVQVYYSEDEIWDGGDVSLLKKSRMIKNLNPGKRKRVKFKALFDHDPSAGYFIVKLEVDGVTVYSTTTAK